MYRSLKPVCGLLKPVCDISLKSLCGLLKPQGARGFTVTASRNTVIVKRVHKPPIITIPGRHPLETPQRILDKTVVHSDDDKWMIYDVEEHHQPHHAVKLILMRNVDDFGVKGQVVTVLFHEAHPKLLLPGFAVYHTEENVERLGDFVIPEDRLVDSSPTAKQFVNFFSKWTFDIVMSSSTPWTIEKWHVVASLRKHGVWLGEDQIHIPGGEIKGPDMGLQNKEFIAVVTVNGHEELKVRCRVHHWAEDTEGLHRDPEAKDWFLRAAEPVWEEERQQLLDMNRRHFNKRQREDKSLAEEIAKYEEWRLQREERLA